MALLNGLLEAVWLDDGESRRLVAVNAAAVQLLGLSEAELPGTPVESLLCTPEDAMFWIEAAIDRQASLDSEMRVRHVDGRTLRVNRRICFIEADASASTGTGHWLATMRDQSRQRAAEQARETLAAELQTARHWPGGSSWRLPARAGTAAPSRC